MTAAELATCKRKLAMLQTELRVCRGELLGKQTLAARRIAQHELGDAVEVARAPDRLLSLTQLQQQRKNIRGIANVYPHYNSYYGRRALPDALNKRHKDVYLLRFLMQDRPDVFAGRVLTPSYTIALVGADSKHYKVLCLKMPAQVPVKDSALLTEVRRAQMPLLVPLALTADFLDMFAPSNKKSGHANLLYIDTHRKQVEIFEPHGMTKWSSEVEKAIAEFFAPLQYTVYSPGMRCVVGPQKYMQQYDKGYCAAMSNLYAVLRVLNPKATADQIYAYMKQGTPSEVAARLEQVAAYVSDFLSGGRSR